MLDIHSKNGLIYKDMSVSYHYNGLDYLRAFLPLFVVAIHTRLASTYGNLSNHEIPGINVFDIVQFNLFMLAVPAFFLISLFLFFRKTQTSTKYDVQRIYELSVLFVFWSGIWILINHTYPERNPADIIIFIVRGGSSIFYFFFSLVFLTVLASFTKNISVRLTWIFLGFSSFMTILFPVLNIYDPAYKYLVAYWNPLLFVPCVFAAKLIAFHEDRLKFRNKTLVIILILYILISVIEWLTLMHPNHELVLATEMPSYARFSIIVGASLLVITSLQITRKPSRIITIMSSAALGVYCVHPFLLSRFVFVKSAGGTVGYFLVVTVASLSITLILKKLFCVRLI